MKHFIKSVGYDGELYHYVCSCGEVISTSDAVPPNHKDAINTNGMLQSEQNSQ